MFIASFAFVCLTLTVSVSARLQNYTVLDFLLDAKRLHGFDHLLIAHNQNTTLAGSFINSISANTDSGNSDSSNGTSLLSDMCAPIDEASYIRRIMQVLKVPVLQLNERGTFLLKRHFSSNVMSVVYLDGASLADHNGLLKAFVASLYFMRQTKVLFLLNYATTDERLLTQLFKFCWQQKMINVVALFADYQDTATFYSYTHFPDFEMETKRIQEDVVDRQVLYPYRLGNLKGYKMPYIIGGSDPRIIVYYHKGKQVVGGFVGHFLQSFAQKHNCHLYEPLPAKMNSFAVPHELLAAVHNGTVEISAGVTFPTIPMKGYSYSYEQLNWCIMMPMEADMPAYDFYWVVFEGFTFVITLALLLVISSVLSTALYQSGYKPGLLDFLLHENCLRGALGQSFTEIPRPSLKVRFIYLQICVLGILLTTSFNSYFSAYVTSAPKVSPLRSFEDIMQAGVKVYAWAPEYNELLGRIKAFNKYAPMFYIEPNYEKYLNIRDSFNTKYGYMMPTTKWLRIHEQQKVFTTPLFRFREDLCFFHNVPMCFPVHDNSVFMDTIYQMILETAQSGLTSYWQRYAFLEMIIAGRLHFVDLSKKNQFKEMKVEDLKYIWMGFGIMTVVVTMVFLGELMIFYRKKFWQCVKAKWLRGCCRQRNQPKWR